MKKSFIILQILAALSVNVSGQNIGIGVPTPIYPLDIAGNMHTYNNAYFDGFVGVGTTSPSYRIQVNNGSIALYNTTDLKFWLFGYSSGNNYFYLAEGGTNRLVVQNGGNVGIGTSVPGSKLDVVGSANISGNLTVNGDKGVMYNHAGSAQLKYYTRQAAFTAVLGAHGTSVEGSIGYASAGFTSTPQVFVGDIVSTGGTVGELYRVQLVIYNVTPTSCNARLINTSNGPVNYNITWNIICIGN